MPLFFHSNVKPEGNGHEIMLHLKKYNVEFDLVMEKVSDIKMKFLWNTIFTKIFKIRLTWMGTRLPHWLSTWNVWWQTYWGAISNGTSRNFWSIKMENPSIDLHRSQIPWKFQNISIELYEGKCCKTVKSIRIETFRLCIKSLKNIPF